MAMDGSYGVTILNDGRYGWDKPDEHTVRLTLFHTPSAIKECTEQQTQDFGKHTFTYSIVGHKGALDPAAIAKREFEKVELPCNIVAITTDSFTSQGQLGRARESFAAEVLPESIEHAGIPFSFGEPDYRNAVSCRSQKVSVPEGTKTLHLLLASAAKDTVNATFKVGEREFVKTVSNYTGFYGVYGWPGYYESEMRTDDIAYIGTHTHNPSERNKACVYTYMYLVSIPVDGATEVELPADRRMTVFSATAEK